MTVWRIGELARRAGVGVETVRFYQRKGLLPVPPRRHRGYRHYGPDALETLRFIRRAKGLGFALSEVAALLSQRRGARFDHAAFREVLRKKIETLEEDARHIAHVRGVLGQLLAECEGAQSEDAKCRAVALLMQAGIE